MTYIIEDLFSLPREEGQMVIIRPFPGEGKQERGNGSFGMLEFPLYSYVVHLFYGFAVDHLVIISYYKISIANSLSGKSFSGLFSILCCIEKNVTEKEKR